MAGRALGAGHAAPPATPHRAGHPRRVPLYAAGSLEFRQAPRQRRSDLAIVRSSPSRRWRLRSPARLILAAVVGVSLLVATGAAVVAVVTRVGATLWPDRTAAGPFVEIIVVPGDTLWTIAQRHLGPQADLRRAVYHLQEWNGLERPAIFPGQRLRVPATWLEGQ